MIKPPKWQVKYMPNLKLILARRREKGELIACIIGGYGNNEKFARTNNHRV